MDAYVFVHDATSDTIEALRALAEDPGSDVRYAAALFGPADAIAAVSASDLTSLGALILGPIRASGAPSTTTAIVLAGGESAFALPIPKWSPPSPNAAFVQVKVAPGAAADVAQLLAEIDGVTGVAVVAGAFDILAEVGGDTAEDVASILLEQLHSVAGIVSTVSMFVVPEPTVSVD